MGQNRESNDHEADLELRVLADDSYGKTTLTYFLSSPNGSAGLPPTEVAGPILRGTTADFQAAQIRKIELLHGRLDVDQTPLEDSEVESKLTGLGRELYDELFPPAMRKLYRQFRLRIKTLHIVSNEPLIPWELLKPFDNSDPADIIDDDYLSLRFQLTRWLVGARPAPKRVYGPKIACAVATGGRDLAELPHAKAERALIAELQKKQPKTVDLSLDAATCTSLERLLRTEELGILHFAGHGDYHPDSPNESSLSLDRPFRAIDLSGPLTNEIYLNRPLVFLNACSVGRLGLSPTGLGGWAHRFVAKCGSGAFLGPQWIVRDDLALAFAETFYQQVSAGEPFGQAVWEARNAVRRLAPANPSWLAFSAFAHPNGRLVFGRNPDRGKSFDDEELAERGLFAVQDRPREPTPGGLPLPPRPYVAHRYTLMPTSDLVGRRSELEILSRWARGPDQGTEDARIFSLIAIGGMGKSALTWKWFNDHASTAMQPLAGRFWWSFYEYDATFERFVCEALAYTTGRHPNSVAELSRYEQERELLAVLDEQPFLLVLDGLERILIAYARMDAARLMDDDLDRVAAHVVDRSAGPWARLTKGDRGGEHLRRAQDPRAGTFLAQLTKIRCSRFLVSSRLCAADLQDRLTRNHLPGSTAYFLQGLRSADSLQLWQALKGGGQAAEVLPVLDHIEHHPLVLRALAGEVAAYRRAPSDFARWRADHPHFDPGQLPLIQARSHILAFALSGLEPKPQRVAQTIAALRMPASFTALASILVGEERTCPSEAALVASLDELENRGVSGWDQVNNQYDMHPLVRGVLWSHLDEDQKKPVDEDLRQYFAAMEPIFQYQVDKESTLTPAIELCHTLTRLGQFEEAYQIFRMRIGDAVLDFMNSHMAVEIFELFFPRGIDHDPNIQDSMERVRLMNDLAQAFELNGQLSKAYRLLQRIAHASEKAGNLSELGYTLGALGSAALKLGQLEESERCALQLINLGTDPSLEVLGPAGQRLLGQSLLARGEAHRAEDCFEAMRNTSDRPSNDVLDFELAECALRAGKLQKARTLILRAIEAQMSMSVYQRSERFDVRLLFLHGSTMLELGKFEESSAMLLDSLTRARAINSGEDEVQTLIRLADLHARRDNLEAARELLEEVWEKVERGSLRLLHSDARNLEAAIELQAGNLEAAGAAAVRAFELAYCDGPPFAYHWGLLEAQAHLRSLSLADPLPVPSLICAPAPARGSSG